MAETIPELDQIDSIPDNALFLLSYSGAASQIVSFDDLKKFFEIIPWVEKWPLPEVFFLYMFGAKEEYLFWIVLIFLGANPREDMKQKPYVPS